MGHLALTTSHLTRTSTSHLALCCDCTGATQVNYSCKYINEDYGSLFNAPDLQVDFTGLGTWEPGAPTIDITGSYVVPCGSMHNYIQLVFWENNGSSDVYSYAIHRINWGGSGVGHTNLTPIESILSYLETGTAVMTTGDPNPYPTRTLVEDVVNPHTLWDHFIGTHFREKRWKTNTDPLRVHFRYVHSGSCGPACDPGINVRGLGLLTSDTDNGLVNANIAVAYV